MGQKPLEHVVATNVRIYRHDSGMSQATLAKRAGLTRTHIGKIEHAQANLTCKSIEQIATALDIHPMLLLAPPVATLNQHLEQNGCSYQTQEDKPSPNKHHTAIHCGDKAYLHFKVAGPELFLLNR